MASSLATSWSAQTDRIARAYRAVEGIGGNFHVTGIPDDYPGELPPANFAPEVMTPLFAFGERMARNGNPWLAEPPGINWLERMD